MISNLEEHQFQKDGLASMRIWQQGWKTQFIALRPRVYWLQACTCSLKSSSTQTASCKFLVNTYLAGTVQHAAVLRVREAVDLNLALHDVRRIDGAPERSAGKPAGDHQRPNTQLLILFQPLPRCPLSWRCSAIESWREICVSGNEAGNSWPNRWPKSSTWALRSCRLR